MHLNEMYLITSDPYMATGNSMGKTQKQVTLFMICLIVNTDLGFSPLPSPLVPSLGFSLVCLYYSAIPRSSRHGLVVSRIISRFIDMYGS